MGAQPQLIEPQPPPIDPEARGRGTISESFMAAFRRVFRRGVAHFATYYLSNTLNAAIPFLLLRPLTDYLTPNDYGIISIFQALIVFTVPVALLSVNTAITTAYFHLEKHEHPSYVSSALFVSLTSSLALTGFMFAARAALAGWLLMPVPLLLLAPIFSLMQLVPLTVLALYQASGRPRSYGALQITITALNAGVSVLLVCGFRMGYAGRLWGIGLAYASCSLWGLWKLKASGYLTRKIRFDYCVRLIKFGGPLIPYSIGGALTGLSDRFIIRRFVGSDALGIYAVGIQIASIMLIAVTALNQAWVPFLFHKLSTGGEAIKRTLVKYSYILMGGIGILYAATVLLAPLVFHIFVNHRFATAAPYVRWLAIGYAFNGVYYIVGNYLFYHSRTVIVGVLSVLNAAGSVSLNLFLVPRYGAMGAAYSSACSWCVFVAVMWIWSAYVFPMPWLSVIGSAARTGRNQLFRSLRIKGTY